MKKFSYFILPFICVIKFHQILAEPNPKKPNASNVKLDCPDSFLEKCQCGKQPYPHHDSEVKYVVNCTNSRFTDADMLIELPDEVEVLIFTGNMLDELEDNIFGLGFNYKKLKYIDMSNNHISFIRGQTFHGVRSVETLILNFNEIEITDRFLRHRIFSNFENLKNLHLTDAFTDRLNASAYYLISLEDIFTESKLSKLERLHLERNEVFTMGSNTSIFCPLKSLQHLYLADNKIRDIEFRIDCLNHLNFIDLRYNSINKLSHKATKSLDSYVKSKRPLTINLRDNPLVCDCRSKNFVHWLSKTSVEIDDFDQYVCADGFPVDNVKKKIYQVEKLSCPGSHSQGYSSSTVGFLSFIIVALILMSAVLGVYYKHKITAIVQPLVDDLTRKVGYKGLVNDDASTEVNV